MAYAPDLVADLRRSADGSSDATRDYAYSHDEAGNVARAGRVDAAGHGRAAFEADALNFHAVRRWNAIDLVGVAREDAWVLVDGKPVLRDGRRFVYSLPLAEGAPAHVTNLAVQARVSDDDEEWVAQRSVTLRLPACPEAINVALAGATVGDSLAEYLFDARNRLRRVTDKVGAPRLRAIYDYYPDGRRARKIVSVWTNGVWQDACTNQFIYNEWNLVREVVTDSDTGTTTRDYTWGLDLAGLQSGAWEQESGGIGGLLAITEVSGTATNILLPICDQVGTIHALVAVVTNNVTLETPVVVAEYEYAPFGELGSADGPFAASCPVGFQSKYRDPETGFWYYGYRYYDAKACKWLTADPLGEAGGLNLTGFCGGDPVNQVDPLGLEIGYFVKLEVGFEFGGVLSSQASRDRIGARYHEPLGIRTSLNLTGGVGIRESLHANADVTGEVVGSIMINNLRTSRRNEGVDFDISLIPSAHFHSETEGRPMRTVVLGEDSVFLNEYNRSLSVVPAALNYHSGLKLRTLITDISYRSGETQLGTYNDVLFGTDQARTAGLHLRRGDNIIAHDVFTGPRDRTQREEDRRFYRLTPDQRAYNRSRTSVTMADTDGSRLRLSMDDSFGIVQRPFHYFLNTDYLLHTSKPAEEWGSLYFHFDENRVRVHQLYDARGVR